MPTSVLLSVKPCFAEAIFSGAKTFEFRRALFKSKDVVNIVVYASSPVQMVLGEFTIAEILSMPPNELWALTCHGAGITRMYFDDYFKGRLIAHAIGVKAAHRYSRPRRLDEHYGLDAPPQSFCYVTSEAV